MALVADEVMVYGPLFPFPDAPIQAPHVRDRHNRVWSRWDGVSPFTFCGPFYDALPGRSFVRTIDASQACGPPGLNVGPPG